jgi:hypothetical protein
MQRARGARKGEMGRREGKKGRGNGVGGGWRRGDEARCGKGGAIIGGTYGPG